MAGPLPVIQIFSLCHPSRSERGVKRLGNAHICPAPGQFPQLQRAAAEKGNCYRIGGDEFVVSLNGSREALLACADRIREEIAVADAGSEFPVSAALGLAWSEDQPDPIPAQVFRQADDAMYEDKKRMKASREA